MTAPLLAGLAAFGAALAVHVLWWRVRRPRNAPLALAVLFSAPLPILVWVQPAAAVLHLCLGAAWIMVYPGIETGIPTLRIMLMLEAAPGGLTREEILAGLDQGSLRSDRVADLEAAGWAARRDGKLSLAGPGLWLAAFYRAYRAALGLPLKGG